MKTPQHVIVIGAGIVGVSTAIWLQRSGVSVTLVDREGLVGYCHEKIKLGHVCLFCQKIFTTWQGCQKHMISTSHTKLRYENGVDLEEFTVFYDFREADAEFLGRHKATKTPLIPPGAKHILPKPKNVTTAIATFTYREGPNKALEALGT